MFPCFFNGSMDENSGYICMVLLKPYIVRAAFPLPNTLIQHFSWHSWQIPALL